MLDVSVPRQEGLIYAIGVRVECEGMVNMRNDRAAECIVIVNAVAVTIIVIVAVPAERRRIVVVATASLLVMALGILLGTLL